MNMIEARASIRNFQCNFQSGRLSLGVLKPNPQDARMLGTLSLRKRVAELPTREQGHTVGSAGVEGHRTGKTRVSARFVILT